MATRKLKITDPLFMGNCRQSCFMGDILELNEATGEVTINGTIILDGKKDFEILERMSKMPYARVEIYKSRKKSVKKIEAPKEAEEVIEEIVEEEKSENLDSE